MRPDRYATTRPIAVPTSAEHAALPHHQPEHAGRRRAERQPRRHLAAPLRHARRRRRRRCRRPRARPPRAPKISISVMPSCWRRIVAGDEIASPARTRPRSADRTRRTSSRIADWSRRRGRSATSRRPSSGGAAAPASAASRRPAPPRRSPSSAARRPRRRRPSPRCADRGRVAGRELHADRIAAVEVALHERLVDDRDRACVVGRSSARSRAPAAAACPIAAK